MKKVIGIVLLIILVLAVFIGAQQIPKKEINEKPIEGQVNVIETEEIKAIHYISDKELSQLYTCRSDERKLDKNIVEIEQSDAELLMKIAASEAGSENQLAQEWVMRVILNRLEDGSFGNSIYEIISATGQFQVYSNGMYNKVIITPETHYALANIESGWDESQGALYFEASTNSNESWHHKNREFIAEISGQRYYK